LASAFIVSLSMPLNTKPRAGKAWLAAVALPTGPTVRAI
jgi:hypothetical protein